MEWMRCNKCYRVMKNSDKSFSMTQCRHLFCSRCIVEATKQCPQCKEVNVMALPLQNPPQKQLLHYFEPVRNLIELTYEAAQFQRCQFMIALRRFDEIEQKYQSMKQTYWQAIMHKKAVMQAYQKLKEENEKYWKIRNDQIRSGCTRMPENKSMDAQSLRIGSLSVKNGQIRSVDGRNIQMQQSDVRNLQIRSTDSRNASIRSTDMRSSHTRPTDPRTNAAPSLDVRKNEITSSCARNTPIRSTDMRSSHIRPTDPQNIARSQKINCPDHSNYHSSQRNKRTLDHVSKERPKYQARQIVEYRYDSSHDFAPYRHETRATMLDSATDPEDTPRHNNLRVTNNQRILHSAGMSSNITSDGTFENTPNKNQHIINYNKNYSNNYSNPKFIRHM